MEGKTAMSTTPKTLQEAIVYFSDPDRCFEYAKKLRWPDGNVICPRCNAAKNSFIKTRKLWFCYACKKQFTIKVKTIMEDSPITLDKWMSAFWLLSNSKNGISSHELGRSLGVTQTTAWFMLQRVRKVLKEDFGYGPLRKIGGVGNELEADEAFIGGRVEYMHRNRREEAEGAGPRKNKTIVQGILDRNLRQVRAHVVPNLTREVLQREILRNVKYGSTVYTDEASAYMHGMQWRYIHDVVNKTESYVRGRVHVNGIENFWALLKRSLRGTYVAVEPFHLSRYVDEQVFRFNNRSTKEQRRSDTDRFELAMSNVLGRRLTYADLTGKSDSPHHETTGTRETPQTDVPF
jgi:transposase-like protein